MDIGFDKLQTYENIRGYELVIEKLGAWPNFENATVLSVQMDQTGTNLLPGPILKANILLQDTKDDIDDQGCFQSRTEAIINLTFADVSDLNLSGFELKNTLYEIVIRDTPHLHSPKARFQVEFSPLQGIRDSFVCAEIEVSFLEYHMPDQGIELV